MEHDESLQCKLIKLKDLAASLGLTKHVANLLYEQEIVIHHLNQRIHQLETILTYKNCHRFVASHHNKEALCLCHGNEDCSKDGFPETIKPFIIGIAEN